MITQLGWKMKVLNPKNSLIDDILIQAITKENSFLEN